MKSNLDDELKQLLDNNPNLPAAFQRFLEDQAKYRLAFGGKESGIQPAFRPTLNYQTNE